MTFTKCHIHYVINFGSLYFLYLHTLNISWYFTAIQFGLLYSRALCYDVTFVAHCIRMHSISYDYPMICDTFNIRMHFRILHNFLDAYIQIHSMFYYLMLLYFSSYFIHMHLKCFVILCNFFSWKYILINSMFYYSMLFVYSHALDV